VYQSGEQQDSNYLPDHPLNNVSLYLLVYIACGMGHTKKWAQCGPPRRSPAPAPAHCSSGCWMYNCRVS